MKIKSIKAKNFKNYKKLSLDFDNLKGLNLIQGNNGTGKTTILDSICYAFYGKTSTGIGGDDIVNRSVGKNTMVELVFNVKDTDYTIIRYRKDKANGNDIFIYKGDDDISLPSIKGTNAKIEELVGIPYNIFLSSVLFNSSSANLFINSTDKKRKELLEELLGVDIFKKSLDLVKKDIKLNQDKQINLEDTVKQQDLLKEQQKQLNDNYQVLLSNHNQQIENLKKQVEQLSNLSNVDIDSIDKKLSELNTDISNLKQLVKPVDTTAITKLQGKKSELQLGVDNTLYEVKLRKQLIKDNVEQFNEIKNSPSPRCKYCGNLLDAEHKKKEMLRLKHEVDDAKSFIQRAKQPYLEDQAKVKELTKEIETLQDKAKKQQAELDKNLGIINAKQSEYYQWVSKKENYESNKNALGQAKQNLANMQNTTVEKPKTVFNEEYYNDLISQLDGLKQELTTLETVKDIYSNKGVKSSYISSVIPVINNKIDEYLSILSDETFTASISTKTTAKNGNVSDKIDLVIDYPSRNGNIAFTELSSGEKRLVSLSVNLAFNYYLNINNPINTLFLDEVLDTLSSNRISNVFTLIEKLKQEYDSVFLISHVSDIKENAGVDNVIEINHNKDKQALLEV